MAKFYKMSALGNDFVIFETGTPKFSKEQIAHIAHRRNGIGCDQVLFMAKGEDGISDCEVTIHNQDGGRAEACGNAARCVALLLHHQNRKSEQTIAVGDRHLDAEILASSDETGGETSGETGGELKSGQSAKVRIDMGEVKFDWRDIPLAEAADTQNLPLGNSKFKGGIAVNVGNPHSVFFVETVAQTALAEKGSEVENHPLFPRKTNVEVATVAADHIQMRVWERGVGITPACGSGACAVLAAAALKGLSPRHNKIVCDGGELEVEWLGDNHILLSGEARLNFKGEWVG